MTTLGAARSRAASTSRSRSPSRVSVGAWLVAWFTEAPLADWLAFTVFGLERGSHFGEAVAFFLLDVPKVLLLLLGIITVVTLIRGFFPPERVRAALAGRGTLASAPSRRPRFGIVTPFCSCSAVPLFIGFVEAGHPAGRHLRLPHQLADGQRGRPGPAVGPLRARHRARLHGRRTGGGDRRRAVIGRLRMERYVEDYVWALQGTGGATIEIKLTWADRIRDAWAYTKDLVRRITPYLMIGIGIGALIHGYAPTELVAAIGGRSNPLAVPIVVLIALPLYSNAAGTIPIVQALLGKGMPLGTTLAFMMAITAISLPEFIILRRVIRWPLIAVFATVVTIGILVIGYLFNALIA